MQNETNIMGQTPKLVGYGVDTLILNVRYADKQGQQELEEKLAATLVVHGGAALCRATWCG